MGKFIEILLAFYSLTKMFEKKIITFSYLGSLVGLNKPIKIFVAIVFYIHIHLSYTGNFYLWILLPGRETNFLGLSKPANIHFQPGSLV
jgi:hypothetical protein